MRPRQPSERWVAFLWDYICTTTPGGDNQGSGGRENSNNVFERIKLFEDTWPLFPATGGVGSDAIRVLLQLHPRMPVVSPLSDGASSVVSGYDIRLTDEVKKVRVEKIA